MCNPVHACVQMYACVHLCVLVYVYACSINVWICVCLYMYVYLGIYLSVGGVQNYNHCLSSLLLILHSQQGV